MVVRTTSKNELARKEPLHEKPSIVSVASTSCAPLGHHEIPDELPSPSPSEDPLIDHAQWIRNPKATKFLFGLLTSMYVFLLTVVSCLIELSSAWSSKDLWLAETIFSLLMYIIAILFFLYTYFMIIYPKPVNTLILFLNKKTSWVQRPDRWLISEPVHNGEGAGTLYLRLGALFFGTLGSVLWGCEIYLCFSGECYHRFTVSKHIAAIIFTFLQMHFIVCNSKITFSSSNRLASFGMIHCVAVNLWSWFTMCLVKAQVKKLKKDKKEWEYNNKKNYTEVSSESSDSSSSSEELEATTLFEGLVEAVEQVIVKMKPYTSTSTSSSYPVYNSSNSTTHLRMQSMARLGDISNFLLTCLVEYSLIGAAVCFIIWKYMGETNVDLVKTDRRKKRLRMDCRSTTVGLFAGIFFMTAAFVSIGIFSMLYNKKNGNADLVIGIVSLVLFVVGLLATCFGFWRMRVLQYRLHAHGEVIDEILLIIGLVGEIIYCSIGFDMFINGRRLNQDVPNLAVAVFTFRILQVILQAMYILIASRLRCLSETNALYQPGKQTLTFLVIINITLFVYHTYEGMKSTYGFPNIMESKYFELLNMASPLVVFYRFHSSACLAEIWKHTYSTKKHHHHHPTQEVTSSDLPQHHV